MSLLRLPLETMSFFKLLRRLNLMALPTSKFTRATVLAMAAEHPKDSRTTRRHPTTLLRFVSTLETCGPLETLSLQAIRRLLEGFRFGSCRQIQVGLQYVSPPLWMA